eukprot:Skav215364  [mRNA]  locus=scaffold1391:617916:618437:- [translate_table: standard]
MLSGRFTDKRKIEYMAAVAEGLKRLKIRAFMVKAAAGQSFGEQTAQGLATPKILVAFCSSTYGEETGGGYETYEELKYVHEQRGDCILLPVRLSPLYPPSPPDDEGKYLCQLVFSPSTVYIDGLREDAGGQHSYIAPMALARQIRKALAARGDGCLEAVAARAQSVSKRAMRR